MEWIICDGKFPPSRSVRGARGDARGVSQAACVGLPASHSTPCGASPAHIASLVRAPLRFAKGACCCAPFAQLTVIVCAPLSFRARCLAVRRARRTPPRTGAATRACPYVWVTRFVGFAVRLRERRRGLVDGRRGLVDGRRVRVRFRRLGCAGRLRGRAMRGGRLPSG